jgi:O-antigen ligase
VKPTVVAAARLAPAASWAPGIAAVGALVLAAAWAVVTLPPYLAVAIVLGGSAAVTAWLVFPDSPVYALLALAPFSISFNLGVLHGVELHDLVLGVLLVTVASAILSGLQKEARFATHVGTGLLILWILIFVWTAFTYRYGSANRWLMSTTVKNTWYIYRQVGRLLLPFPLIVCYLRNPHPARRVVDVLLLVNAGLAVFAILRAPQTQYVATGPFETGNQLAGYLVPVIPFAAARLFLGIGWRGKILGGAALPVMLRALWLTGSRGGLAGAVMSFLPLALFVPRRRLGAAAAVVVVAGLAGVLTQGDILDRPKFQRFLTLGNFENQETFKWRQEQWAMFMNRLAENPWMGTGSDVDKSLAELDRAQTPHNSYLGLAMRSGIPGVALWIALLGVAGLACLRGLLAPAASVDAQILWLGLIGALAGLILHGFGEATLLLSAVQILFWCLLGFSLVELRAVEGLAPARLVIRA